LLPVTDNIRKLPFWNKLTSDLNITIDNINNSEPCIYGYHPHGIWSRGAFFTFGIHGHKHNSYFAIRSWIFYIPIVGLVAKWLGCVSVDKQTITGLLRSGKSVCIALDGVMTNELNINTKRSGFCKIAKETNSLIVPCLGIGEEKLYRGINYFSNVSQKPLHVIFGKSLNSRDFDSIEDIRKCYFEALLDMNATVIK
jgi:hypothetical protein